MRVLTATPLFPSTEHPTQGIFVAQRAAAIRDVDVVVCRCRPWFPLIGRFKPHLAAAHASRESIHGIDVVDLRYEYVPGAFRAFEGASLARHLGRVIDRDERGFDLIDAHFAFPTGHAAVLAAAKRGLPTVVTLRGTIRSYLQDGRRRLIADALRGATRVIAVSSDLARLARDLAGASLDVRVIGNGVDTALFSPGPAVAARARLGLPEDARILLTVGGLVPRKGAQRVLDVLPRLLAREPRTLYVLVGGAGAEGGFEAELRAQVLRSGLEESVRFVGEIGHDRLPDYYRAADVHVLATSNEGWANALQESLACGTPIVATDVGGNREVVGDDSHGSIVPFGDAEALVAAIGARLAAHPDRKSIACWGARRDWQTVGAEVRAVFAEAVLARRGR